MTPRNWQLVALILLLALLLRLPNIGANFAGDEIDTAGPARSFATTGDFRVFDDCNGQAYYNFMHPPVRMLLYSGWAALFGFSNVAMRLLPTLFGIGSVFLIYLLGKEMYSNKVGLIAALIAAISRYHIYGSNLVSTDTGHFMFTTTAAVLFFVIYAKRGGNKHLVTSLALSVVSMLTKFSTIIIFIPIIVAGYLHKKRKMTLLHIIATFVASALIMLGIAAALGNSGIFYEPINGFIGYSQSSSPSFGSLVYDKIFKLATISWQMTPFFAVLLLLALASLYKRKDKNFLILASWLVVGFLIIFIPFGQDTQRYFLMMLTPAFVITAKYLDGINFRDKKIYIVAALLLALAAAVGLNDLMGYYQPIYLGAFYALAVVALAKNRRQMLFAGFIGLSIFFTFSGNLTQIGSQAVGQLSHDAAEYPYREVWTSKDVAYYLTPQNETIRHCYLGSLDKGFIRENNIEYIAFYSTVPRQADMDAVACEKKPIVVNGYPMGFTCKINQSSV